MSVINQNLILPRMMEKGKNPLWTKDEAILALDLYFKINPLKANAQTAEVIELSELLNSLPFHTHENRKQKFRNPSGVHMILCNFLRLDPHYSGKGLQRGSKLQTEVWELFANDLNKLRQTAQLIRESYSSLNDNKKMLDAFVVDEEFSEGEILFSFHKRRERNAALVKRKKDQVLRETGKLSCEVCAFDFYKVYGQLGQGFAECHHNTPLYLAKPNHQTKISELSIVCANCHRMLHRSKSLLSIEKLKSIILNGKI